MNVPLLAVLAASFACQAAAHAYVYWPTSREALDFSKVGSPYSFADKKVQAYLGPRYAGKVKSKHGAGQGGATWARKKTDDDWSKAGDGCNGLAMGAPTATYKEGQEIEVVVPVHAEHGGEYEFRLCTKKWDTMTGDKERLECLDEHLLYRKCVDGKLPYSQCSCGSDGCKRWGNIDANSEIYTKYPGIGLYNGAASCTEGGYLVKMTLPPGATCDHCVLQWYWFTFHNEEFWGCSDIKIEGATSPTKPPVESRRRSPPTPPVESPTKPPVESRRRSPPSSRRRSSRRRSTRRRSPTRRRSTRRRRRKSSRRRSSPRTSSIVGMSSPRSSRGGVEDIVYRRLGCVPDTSPAASSPPSATSYRNTACMSTKEYNASNPCLGGLPFFRLTVHTPNAFGECFRFCTSMGLDLFGMARQGTDCRCGASVENTAVWGDESRSGRIRRWLGTGGTGPSGAEQRGLQVNNDQLSPDSEVCENGIAVYQYSAWLETNPAGTVDLMKNVSPEDRSHIASIVSGGSQARSYGSIR